jgi:hypothetical protein
MDPSVESWFVREDLDPVGDPYGVMREPDDPEEEEEEEAFERRAELRARYADRWSWFRQKAKRANRRARVRGDHGRLTTDDVAAVYDAAAGRCHHCGSLADQPAPGGPWDATGRRIGTIDHVQQRGVAAPWAGEEAHLWNIVENLVWCCMWCNTWTSERRPGATDHGGLHPRPGGEPTGGPTQQ